MKNIEIYNTLNIDKDSSSIVATFTQEDDAVMEFKLFKDGQEIVLEDQTISLGAERKDGAVIEQDDGFLIKENNVLNITLKKNIISVVGVVKIQLYLKDTSGEMASNTFNIRVNKKLLGAENIEATNDIKTLNTLVLELKNNTNKLIDDTKAKADKLLNGLQETGDNLSSTVKAKTDKLIEDTKKDYDSLKKTIIDENISIKLQEDIKSLQNGLKSNQALAYSGSSISSKNTLEGRTEGMKIKGRTLQNLIPKQTVTLNSSTTSKAFQIFSIKANTDFILSVNITAKKAPKNGLRCGFKKNDGSWVYSDFTTGVGTQKRKFNLTYDIEAITFYIPSDEFASTPDANITFIEPMAYIGDIETNYFEGIKSFGELEQEGDKYKISLLSQNDNFLYNLKRVSLDVGTGAEISSDIYFTSDYVVNSLPTYYKALLDNEYILTNVFYYDSDKKYTGNQLNIVGLSSFNSYKKAKFIRFVGRREDKSNNVDLNNIKIVVGSKKYTEYFNGMLDKKDILLEKPLREWDTLYEDNGQVKVDRLSGQYTFTGNENFAQLNNDNNSLSVYVDMNTLNLLLNGITVCNNFNYLAPNDLVSKYLDGISISGSSKNRFLFRISTSKLSTPDIDGFKAWLKANPTTVIYQLATPTTEIVENCVDIDLDTYQDVTYVNILNSLPGELDFKVPSNIGSSLQNLAKEVNNIWDVINNLLVPSLIETNKNIALATIKNNLK